MARSKKSIIQNLTGMGWDKSIANLAYNQWGVSALEVLKQDPFAALFINRQIKWRALDVVAQKIGFQEFSIERIIGGIRYALFSAIGDGHVFLPLIELKQRTSQLLRLEDESNWLEAMEVMLNNREIIDRSISSSINDNVYLRDLYAAETNIAKHLAKMHSTPSRLSLNEPSMAEIDEIERDLRITLAPPQKNAISASLSSKLSIITGGPGTGKTTIVRGILKLWKKHGARIKLAAPTGRAAKRLSESTGRKAFTIHRLLEYNSDAGAFMRDSHKQLRADLMIVDESSMIDTELMASLLDALPPSCSLLLVGDVDQLPAVGPGFVLHDMIKTGLLCTISLEEIYRQQEGSLISSNAQRINQGQFPELENGGIESGQDFFFVQRSSPLDAREAITEMVTNRIPKQFGLNPKEDIQVLCPMIKRDVGVESMNDALQESLNPCPGKFKAPFYSMSLGDKIMQTKNDYQKDVFNGDIGYVTDIDNKAKEVEINFEGRTIHYEWNELVNTTLAYAVTVHKSQGSEYPAVVIPIVKQHYPMLQRNLLYTAVSRGKQLVVIIGEPSALEIAISNNRIRTRYTGLQQMIQDAFVTTKHKNK